MLALPYRYDPYLGYLPETHGPHHTPIQTYLLPSSYPSLNNASASRRCRSRRTIGPPRRRSNPRRTPSSARSRSLGHLRRGRRPAGHNVLGSDGHVDRGGVRLEHGHRAVLDGPRVRHQNSLAHADQPESITAGAGFQLFWDSKEILTKRQGVVSILQGNY